MFNCNYLCRNFQQLRLHEWKGDGNGVVWEPYVNCNYPWICLCGVTRINNFCKMSLDVLPFQGHRPTRLHCQLEIFCASRLNFDDFIYIRFTTSSLMNEQIWQRANSPKFIVKCLRLLLLLQTDALTSPVQPTKGHYYQRQFHELLHCEPKKTHIMFLPYLLQNETDSDKVWYMFS